MSRPFLNNRSRRKRFDVVVYAAWAAPLLGGSSFGGATGGGETQAVLLATELARRGLRAGIVVIAPNGELPVTVAGVHVIRQRPRRGARGPIARAALALGAVATLARISTDVLIQMNAGPTTGIAALVTRLRGAHFIYMSMHVMDFAFANFEPRALNVMLYEWGVRNASEIVVQDHHQARLSREQLGREPVVISSISTPAEPRTRPPEAFLWVGRLQEWKDPGAYLDLARSVPEARFWMIVVPQKGESPDARRRFANAAASIPNLRLLEPRPREALGELMNRAVAIVSTSRSEGMPNVFLEGWSRGVPALVLSFDPDGMIERHGLGLWADGDPDRLAELARGLWHDRVHQGELSGRCIAYVRAEHGAEPLGDLWVRTIERVRAARP